MSRLRIAKLPLHTSMKTRQEEEELDNHPYEQRHPKANLCLDTKKGVRREHSLALAIRMKKRSRGLLFQVLEDVRLASNIPMRRDTAASMWEVEDDCNKLYCELASRRLER